MSEYYSPEVEKTMKLLYENLSEKDRRLYAAVEAQKLGHGGIQYISDLFDCSRQTIHTALDELKKKDFLPADQIRRVGAGRHTAIEQYKDLDEIFLKVIEDDIAGDPMNKDIRWVKLTKADIIKKLLRYGIRIGRNIVRKLLKKTPFC